MTESEYQREAQRLRPMLVNMGKQLLGDSEAAEDAAQEVLLKLWQRVNDLRIPLDGLARTAMHNHCISGRMVINLCLGIYIAQAEDEEFRVVDAV